MNRRRLGALVVVVGLAALSVGRYETISEQGKQLLERTPDPVALVLVSLVVAVVGLFLFIKLGGLVYPVVRRLFRPVTRLWDAIMPESVIVRFGVGITVMALLFLVGPLVALQTLELGEGEDPVEDQNGNDAGDDADNETDDENGDDTDGSNADDNPDDPDEPPGGNSTDDGGNENTTDGNTTGAVALSVP